VAAMRTNAATDAARVVRITRPRWSPQHRNESGACAENLGKLMLQPTFRTEALIWVIFSDKTMHNDLPGTGAGAGARRLD
jgi:hypothetical protein